MNMKKKIIKKTLSDKPDKIDGGIPPKTYTSDELVGINPEIFELVFDKAWNTQRRFKILTGCKTNGTTDLELGNICSDPECISCTRFKKAFKEEAKKWENKKN